MRAFGGMSACHDVPGMNRRPTERFSDRVEHYRRCRPGYPPAFYTEVQALCGLAPHHAVADMGAGTGLSAEPFLRAGHRVIGVEPNWPMAAAGARSLRPWPAFAMLNATAERTGLAAGSVDCIAAGQAFHWFDADSAAREWRRIARPDAWIVLFWNSRRTDSTPFLRAYETFLCEHGTDYRDVAERQASPGDMAVVFSGAPTREAALPNRQVFDWEGLKGRALSSSYLPEAGTPRGQRMLGALATLFDAHADASGNVTFEYDTRIYAGPATPRGRT